MRPSKQLYMFLIRSYIFLKILGEESQDTNFSDDQSSNHEVISNSQQPLNHLMFVSILEHICMLYGKDEETSEALFKGMFKFYLILTFFTYSHLKIT